MGERARRAWETCSQREGARVVGEMKRPQKKGDKMFVAPDH